MRRDLVALFLLLGCSDYEVNSKPEEPLPGGDEECPDAGAAYAVEQDASCVVVAEVGTFTPVVEWQWQTNDTFAGFDDIMSTPAAANLTDDDGDGDVDEDDVPDLVFTSFSGGAYTSAGTLTAIGGDGSGTLWSVYDPGGHHVYSSGSPAIGDIDGDGRVEVCTGGVEAAVVCVDQAGGFKWAGGTSIYGYGAPAFADLEGDGQAEVMYGPQVLDSAGNVRFTGAGGTGYWLSFAVDLDGDGKLEIVAGNTVYKGNGDILWTDGTGDGPAAVGDFDLDGTPEIVHVTSGSIVLTGADGVVRWTQSLPGGCHGGAPTVADFDNDGFPEVGVAGAYYYTVLDTDGSVLWSMPVQDTSSCVTGSSVFDFEGDGASDVVYADELTLWVYDGATGAVKLQEDGHASGTLYEYPLILDVDNDGSTEIVVPSNDYGYDGYNGITVIGDANGSWRPSRTIWNQYAYHITNVEDDGGIPTTQDPNWERWNTFRAGGTTYGLNSELADLVPGEPTVCTLRCDEDVVEVTLPVENRGLADTPAFDAGLYKDGQLVGDGATLSLAAGEAAWVGPFEVTREQWRGGAVLAKLDTLGAVEECDEGDNARTLGDWPCEGEE